MSDQSDATRLPDTPHRAAVLAGLFLAELVLLAVAYQILTDFECRQTAIEGVCRGFQGLVARALCLAGVAVIILRAQGSPLGSFLIAAGTPRPIVWPILHLLGVAGLAAPLVMAPDGQLAAVFGPALILWAVSAPLAMIGGLLWLAGIRVWGRLVLDLGPVGWLAAALALCLPDLARWAAPVWDIGLAEITFSATAALLGALGTDPLLIPEEARIGVGDFVVQVAASCSGIEGLVLVSAFGLMTAFLFREELHLGRFALVLMPLALLVSWCFNILRIAVLILIGAGGRPGLAMNGFHSHAGWLFFGLVALFILTAALGWSWLRRQPAARPGRPFRADPVAFMLVPFAGFMAASLVTKTFWSEPDLAYPVMIGAVVLVLLPFGRQIVRMIAAPEVLPVAAGLAVAAIWLVLVPRAEPPGHLAALPVEAVAAWWTVRLLGAVLVIPLVEEAFFRGYLLTRLNRGGPIWRLVAIGLSTAAFAALHGAWLAAIPAGLVFAGIFLWRGRLWDAVVAHMTANLAVGLIALWMQQPGLI
jgi:hypothetical protein